VKLVWEKEPRAAFEKLRVGKQNKILRPALRKGGKEFSRDLKRVAPKKTGALRVAIGLVVKGRRGKNPYVVIGAKSNYRKIRKKRGKIIRRTRGARKGESYESWPAKYYHLVESGHKHPRRRGLLRRAGQRLRQLFGGGRVPAHPFAKPQLLRGWPRYSETIMREIGYRIRQTLNES
jgi:hypothetical protein